MSEVHEDEISIRDIFVLLKRNYAFLKSKWLVIASAAVLCSGAGFFYATIKPVTHTAKLVFAFSNGEEGMSNLGGIASQFGLNLGGGGESFFQHNNLLELMKSRRLITKTLMTRCEVGSKQDFLINHIISHEFQKGKTKKAAINDVYFKDTVAFFRGDSFLNRYCKNSIPRNLQIALVDKKLSYVSVGFTSKNDTISKLFVESLVNEATRFYHEFQTRRYFTTLNTLNEKIDSVENELQKAMVGSAVEVDRGSLYIRYSPRVQQVKNQLNTQILGTMHAELIKNAEIQKTLLSQQEPLFEVIDKPVFPLEKKKASRLVYLIVGAFLGTFLTSAYLLMRRWFLTQITPVLD